MKALRTDNGGEYVNKELANYLTQKGIRHDLTPPYSPESNGIAERLNRSIGEGIRAMLSNIAEKRLWAEAVHTFVYTKNRLFHGSVCGQTPYKAFHGYKPTLKHLRLFGGKCFLHIPKAKLPSGSKLLPRAEPGLFVGYGDAQHHYRIYTPSNGRVTTSADVKFPPSEDKAVATSSH